MSRRIRIGSLIFLSGALAFALALSPAIAAAETESVTLTVTAVAKKDVNPPAVSRNDVQFFQNKERTQIADWRHGERLYLAVLIDDSMNSTDWSDGSRMACLGRLTQSDPTRLGEWTGAASYCLGTTAPFTFMAYLHKLATHLPNPYSLTCKSSGGAKGRFARVKVAAEL